VSRKEFLGKVRGETSLIERIINYIPGYRGYKEKEMRRESDRLVRMEVVNRLKSAKTIFRRSFANPFFAQRLSGADAYRFDTFLSRLDGVTQRIDHAVVGYAGMFDTVKVGEDKLDAILECDLSLVEKAEAVKAGVEKVVRMEVRGEEWRHAMEELIYIVEELDRLVKQRSKILRGINL